MKKIDSLIFARWIVTVDHDDAVLENQAVAVDKGKVIDILPQAAAQEKYQANHFYERHSHILLPGLINSHTHAAMNLFKGMADDVPLMEWLDKHIWPAENQWVSRKFVEDGTELAIAEMLKSGTTCFNDMYFYPDVSARVSVKTGIRAVIGLIVLDFPTMWAENADEYISKGVNIHDAYRDSSRISTMFAPHAPYTVSDESLIKVQTLADELQMAVHIHLHETAFEVDETIKSTGGRPLARLESLGLLGPSLVAVHMTQLTEDEIFLLAKTKVNVVHCPASNMKLASGFCPVQALKDAGVNVSLGTDSSASNNDLNLFGEMKLAALIGKGYFSDPKALNANMVLRMATINGARALGLEEKVGSIEIGKEADMIVVDINEPATSPVYNPVSHLVYSTARNQISDVWVAGKILLKDKMLLTINETSLMKKSQNWADKIKEI